MKGICRDPDWLESYHMESLSIMDHGLGPSKTGCFPGTLVFGEALILPMKKTQHHSTYL